MKSVTQFMRCTLRGLSIGAAATLGFTAINVAAQGQLDATFGVERASPYRPAGVIADWPVSRLFSTRNVLSNGLVRRGDGSVIVANQCPRTNPPELGVCLHALNADGASMDSFGLSGTVDFETSFSSLQALALDRQENIWVSGVCSGSACLLKLSPTGALFNRLGTAANLTQAAIIGMSSANTIDMTFDDKMYVGGACPALGRLLPCAIRMNPNGTPDATFNGGNVLVWGNDSSFSTGALASGEVLKIKAYGDGRAYAAGNCNYPRSFMCVAIIETNGTIAPVFTSFPDGSYDVESYFYAQPPGSNSEAFRDMVVQTDGSAVLLGRCVYAMSGQTNRETPCLTKVRADSQLDTFFSSNGYLVPYASRTDVSPSGLVLREDGSMIVASACSVTTAGRQGLCLSALSAGGASSKQFAGDATQKEVEFDPTNAGQPLVTARLTGVTLGAIRYNNTALMTFGFCPAPGLVLQACVARITLAPTGVKSCLPDIDGDGKLNAMTDGLLLLRGMFGLFGDALTKNVVGTGATRSQTNIEDYLTIRCGLPVNQ